MLKFEVHYDEVDGDELHTHKLFKPVPAVSMLPEWFKRLKTSDDPDISYHTVKQCRGVWDILSMGYLFLWPFDAEIIKDDHGKLDIIKSRSQTNENFKPHGHIQMNGYKDLNFQNQSQGIQKLMTPYRLKTPPGTSVMLVQPPYRPELKTIISPGIIDTDKYYGDFSILFTLKDISGNRNSKIKAGTPLAQVIPFQRQDWELKFDKIDNKKRDAFSILSSDIQKFYQKMIWNRKVFKNEGN